MPCTKIRVSAKTLYKGQMTVHFPGLFSLTHKFAHALSVTLPKFLQSVSRQVNDDWQKGSPMLYPHPQCPYPKGTPGGGSTLIGLVSPTTKNWTWNIANIIQASKANKASKAIKIIDKGLSVFTVQFVLRNEMINLLLRYSMLIYVERIRLIMIDIQ